MVNLTRTIDRATGYVFVPAPNDSQSNPALPDTTNANQAAPSQRPNTYALFSSALAPLPGPGTDVRDIQERWITAREEYDAFEKKEWRREGELVRQQQKEQQKQQSADSADL